MTRVYGTIHEAYMHLDPQTFADVDELTDMYIAIKHETRKPPLRLAAAMALELAQNPHNTWAMRTAFTEETERRYDEVSGDNTHVVDGELADMTRAHLPYLLYENQTLARQKSVEDSSAVMTQWKQWWVKHLGSPRQGDIGYAYELGASMMVNASDAGLIAYPALSRQEGNRRLVDGKKYAWDVSIESDGSVVDKGLYHVQVKSSKNRSFYEYHHNIHVLHAGRAYVNRTDVYRLPEYLHSRDGRGKWIVENGQNMILEELAAKPPATDDMVYLK